MASSLEKNDYMVSLELPAPPGWTEKVMSKGRGTPRKNEIIFTAPTGEEITNTRQLKQCLKSHPGGPAISEFDWGTGESPRRSVRICEKAKSTPPTESESPKKRSRKSLVLKKDDKEKEVISEETDVVKEVDMQEAEQIKDNEVSNTKKDEVKENQNQHRAQAQDTGEDTLKENQGDKKDGGEDPDGKTEEAPPEEDKIGKNVKMSADAEESEKYAETEPEHPKEPQIEKAADMAEVTRGQGLVEDLKVQEKVEETSIETRKEDVIGEHEEQNAAAEEKKYKLEGEREEEYKSGAANQSSGKEENLVENVVSKVVEGEVDDNGSHGLGKETESSKSKQALGEKEKIPFYDPFDH